MNTTTQLPPVFGGKIIELLEDFVSEPQLVTEVQNELTVIRKDFEKLVAKYTKEIKDLKDEVDERDQKITDLKDTIDTLEDQIEEAEKNNEEEDDEEEADYEDLAISAGFGLVKVISLDQREKLREFAEREIWPHYNDQQNNIKI